MTPVFCRLAKISIASLVLCASLRFSGTVLDQREAIIGSVFLFILSTGTVLDRREGVRGKFKVETLCMYVCTCVNPLTEADDLLAWFHIKFLTLISFLCLPVEIFLWIPFFLFPSFFSSLFPCGRLAGFWNHASILFCGLLLKERSFRFTYLGFCWRKKEKSLVYLGSRSISSVKSTHWVLIFPLFYASAWTLLHPCKFFIQLDNSCRKVPMFSLKSFVHGFSSHVPSHFPNRIYSNSKHNPVSLMEFPLTLINNLFLLSDVVWWIMEWAHISYFTSISSLGLFLQNHVIS